MFMLQGKLCFRNFQSIATEKGDPIPLGPMEFHEAGEAVYIDDEIGTHSIANGSDKPAISVHLYAGPIPRCRIYNEVKKKFDWVDLEYFSLPEANLG